MFWDFLRVDVFVNSGVEFHLRIYYYELLNDELLHTENAWSGILNEKTVVEGPIEEIKLRKMTSLEGTQFGFCKGKGTVDAIFVIRQLAEKFRASSKTLHMLFADLEKAFDMVPRKVIEWALRRKGVVE